MSRGLEYLTDEDDLDDVQSFEKIRHKPKLTARVEDLQKRKKDGQLRKQLQQGNKYDR
jgi:hypothetical protein